MELSISNVVNISVAQAQSGLGEYNTSNLALFTSEVYGGGFGSDGYKIYLDPSEVATDFGTSSRTYLEALAIFSQQPNILAGGGYLVIIPTIVEVQNVAFSGVPASGTFVLNYGALPSAAINWNDTAAQIQTKLRAIAGLEAVVVTGSMGTSLNITFNGVLANIAVLTASSVTLQTSAPAAITPTITQTTAGESLATAIARTEDLVQYFGIIASDLINETDGLAAAAVVQAMNKILFLVSRTEADVDPAGYLDLLRSGGFYKTRGLFYGADNDTDSLVMAASYAARGLSVDFSGSNTTLTMHLKDLSGVQPDPSMTQTILQKCIDAGADTYVSLQGVSKVFCSGENRFFDQVYNLLWLVGALQVAGFNFLAQSSSKIPQTEAGMDGLKGAYRNVCEQAVSNQYSAPGSWTSPVTFGNQSDLLANISQRGYYIYSAPISQQAQAAREARQAPLVQIALKEAGAIQSSNVIVNINA